MIPFKYQIYKTLKYYRISVRITPIELLKMHLYESGAIRTRHLFRLCLDRSFFQTMANLFSKTRRLWSARVPLNECNMLTSNSLAMMVDSPRSFVIYFCHKLTQPMNFHIPYIDTLI